MPALYFLSVKDDRNRCHEIYCYRALGQDVPLALRESKCLGRTDVAEISRMAKDVIIHDIAKEKGGPPPALLFWRKRFRATRHTLRSLGDETG